MRVLIILGALAVAIIGIFATMWVLPALLTVVVVIGGAHLVMRERDRRRRIGT